LAELGLNSNYTKIKSDQFSNELVAFLCNAIQENLLEPKLRNRALLMVRQAHHDGRHLRCLRSLQPELVEGKTTMENSNA
jgi:hypothetical protein